MRETVSTIIPAYNAGAYLARAIDSALCQDVSQQIIVIDDGSKDDTADIAAGYGKDVELIRQSNGGVSAARNRGIDASKGDFVAFLDADDTWMPGKLQAQLDLFAVDPALGTVICDEMHVTVEGAVVRPSFLATRRCYRQLPKQPGRLAKPMTWLVQESFFPTSGVLTRRDVLTHAGTFDTSISICEDRDLWIRLAQQGPVGIVPEALVRYLTGRTDSLSATASQVRWAQALSNVLQRYTNQIEAMVWSEGEHPGDLFSEIYGELGDIFWYADQMDLAAGAFKKSIRYGAIRYVPKWVASQTRTAHLIRKALHVLRSK